MRNYKFFLASVLVLLAVPVALAAKGYLFEKNMTDFKSNISKVESRSYKFLANPEPGKDAEALVESLLGKLKDVAKKEGFEFVERKKGPDWRYSEKRYLDTPGLDLYKKGYVVRETYRFKKGEGPDADKFVLTVKEMSPNDFMRLVNSRLGPVPGSDSLVKFEENISLKEEGSLQSYFESAIGSKVSNSELASRTLGDYGKLYPELLNLGLDASTQLVPATGYSVQLKFGGFKLADGTVADGDIEVWTEGPGGKPWVAEIAFDGAGYDATVEHMKAEEDFFAKVFAGDMKGLALTNGYAYMGSKVRTLFDEKHDFSAAPAAAPASAPKGDKPAAPSGAANKPKGNDLDS
jgi:hypothetical protein